MLPHGARIPGGTVPFRYGEAKGIFSFEKRMSPRPPKEKRGGISISPRTPLKRHKGAGCGPPLWKPLPGIGDNRYGVARKSRSLLPAALVNVPRRGVRPQLEVRLKIGMENRTCFSTAFHFAKRWLVLKTELFSVSESISGSGKRNRERPTCTPKSDALSSRCTGPEKICTPPVI